MTTNKRESTQEMFKEALADMEAVTDLGGRKYGYSSWKNPDNPSLQHKSNCASMHRHLSAITVDEYSIDSESKQHHTLHLAWRALALYTRLKRGYTKNDSK